MDSSLFPEMPGDASFLVFRRGKYARSNFICPESSDSIHGQKNNLEEDGTKTVFFVQVHTGRKPSLKMISHELLAKRNYKSESAVEKQ